MPDVPTPTDPPPPPRHGRAQMETVYRQRRLLAGTAFVAVLIVVASGIALLLSGGSSKPAPSAKPARRRASPPTSPLGKPTLGQEESDAVTRTLARQPLVAVAGRRKREIALTFDDGPGPYTLRVARLLERRKVPATFFQVGQEAKVFTDAQQYLVRHHSFVLADHTETHAKLSLLSRAGQISELDDAASVLTLGGAPQPTLFRPPFGAFNHTTLDLLRRRGMLMVLWTVDSQDYERPGTKAIVKRVVDGARPGAIVLMHDAGGDRSQTIAALPSIIKRLRAKHYRLVTVPRLLLDNPPPLRQPPIMAGVG